MSILEHVPIFMIQVGGEVLSSEITKRIVSFTYEDAEKELDQCKIEIADAYSLLDNTQLREGSILRMRWGYPGRLSGEKICTIKEPQFTFDNQGVRLTLVAYDLGHKLAGRKVQKAWNNVSVQEVVETVANKHALKTKTKNVSDTVNEMQAGLSDMQFLKELGSRYGCQVYVEADTLHFHPQEKAEAPSAQYIWGEIFGRFLEFQVQVSNEHGKGKKSKVKSRGIHPDTKELQENYVDESNLGEPRLSAAVYKLDASMGETPLSDSEESGDYAASPAGTSSDAKHRARKGYKTDNVKTTARFIGDPRLNAKGIILLQGLGNAYSGNWYATKMTHDIRDGYICTAELEREGPGTTYNGAFSKAALAPNLQLPKNLINGKIQSFKNQVVTYVDGEEIRLARRFGEYVESL